MAAGEGGTDSKMFVAELLSVYCKYAKSHRLKSSLLAQSDGHALVKFIGQKAGLLFRNESGKHCCQRVPVTESGGRRHTSMISVAVLPVCSPNFKPLREKDLDIKATRGSGPGGQHRNVTDSAIRIVHRPTKISICIDSRCQHQNKKIALQILTARVNDYYMQIEQSKFNQDRKKQMAGGSRGDKIRTYDFIKKRVIDHRLSVRTSKIKAVMKGDLDLILGNK